VTRRTDLEEGMFPYHVKIIRRDGNGQTADDWHATVTRIEDGKQAILMSDWRWWIKRRTRRKALDRRFRAIEARERAMAETIEFRV
jgi:hypothetical protein